ncbi:MAG: SoxR reducing system RseC family protein [Firmicutes bacterium]|nr:SoxR reducing system RseC family protein [Bacillota bacterium]
MIKERGTIRVISDSEIAIDSQLKAGCAGCSHQNSCGAGILSKALPQRSRQIQLPNDGRFHDGQQVELAMQPSTMVRYSLLLYILPLVLLVVGAGVGQWWQPEREWIAIGLAALGFGSSFIWLKRHLDCRHLQVGKLMTVHAIEPQD